MSRVWRCVFCQRLLGKGAGNHLHIQYKRSQYLIEGVRVKITAKCPTCGMKNKTEIFKDERM